MTIDWWTLGFEVVNVAILIWLLGHFFWKPVAAMIEARRAAAAKIIADAEASRDAVTKAEAEIAATRAGFAAEHDRVLADARAEADALRARLKQEAEAEADKIRADAAADLPPAPTRPRRRGRPGRPTLPSPLPAGSSSGRTTRPCARAFSMASSPRCVPCPPPSAAPRPRPTHS